MDQIFNLDKIVILHTEQQKMKINLIQNRQKCLTISVGANLRCYFTSEFFPHGKINLSGTFRGEITLVGGNILSREPQSIWLQHHLLFIQHSRE